MERNFAAMYRILRRLESAMDDDAPDLDALTPEALHVSDNRLDSIWAMLAEDGYVTGVSVRSYDDSRCVVVACPRVTIKGLEFLADNALMRRAARAAKGVKDAVPGL